MSTNAPQKEDFTKLASEQSESSAWGELWSFLKARKKWWLLPILVVMMLFAVLLILSSTGAAPFIYTLF